MDDCRSFYQLVETNEKCQSIYSIAFFTYPVLEIILFFAVIAYFISRYTLKG